MGVRGIRFGLWRGRGRLAARSYATSTWWRWDARCCENVASCVSQLVAATSHLQRPSSCLSRSCGRMLCMKQLPHRRQGRLISSRCQSYVRPARHIGNTVPLPHALQTAQEIGKRRYGRRLLTRPYDLHRQRLHTHLRARSPSTGPPRQIHRQSSVDAQGPDFAPPPAGPTRIANLQHKQHPGLAAHPPLPEARAAVPRPVHAISIRGAPCPRPRRGSRGSAAASLKPTSRARNWAGNLPRLARRVRSRRLWAGALPRTAGVPWAPNCELGRCVRVLLLEVEDAVAAGLAIR